MAHTFNFSIKYFSHWKVKSRPCPPFPREQGIGEKNSGSLVPETFVLFNILLF